MGGVFGFAGRLSGNAFQVVRRAASKSLDRAARKNALWLVLPLGKELPDLARTGLGTGLGLGGEPALGLVDWVRSLEAVAADERIAGVLLRFQGPGPNRWSHVMALHRAIAKLREAGVPVVAWAESLTARAVVAIGTKGVELQRLSVAGFEQHALQVLDLVFGLGASHKDCTHVRRIQ